MSGRQALGREGAGLPVLVVQGAYSLRPVIAAVPARRTAVLRASGL